MQNWNNFTAEIFKFKVKWIWSHIKMFMMLKVRDWVYGWMFCKLLSGIVLVNTDSDIIILGYLFFISRTSEMLVLGNELLSKGLYSDIY